MQSAAFDTFMEDLCESQGAAVRVCFEKSFCLSADVTAAYDPNFSDVYEKRNAAYLNYGIGLCKYTGARGKSGASDADAETVAYIRNLFDEAGVIWQIAELGKVDAGGGGTVAMYLSLIHILRRFRPASGADPEPGHPVFRLSAAGAGGAPGAFLAAGSPGRRKSPLAADPPGLLWLPYGGTGCAAGAGGLYH